MARTPTFSIYWTNFPVVGYRGSLGAGGFTHRNLGFKPSNSQLVVIENQSA